MPVEIVKYEKEYEYDGQIVKKTMEHKIWHMPDGLPDELPPAESMDTDACVRLVGVILHNQAEALSYLYDYRKHRRWTNAGTFADIERDKYSTMWNIKSLEDYFEEDPFCTGYGRAIIDKCRRDVYGKNWKDHPDFRKEEKK